MKKSLYILSLLTCLCGCTITNNSISQVEVDDVYFMPSDRKLSSYHSTPKNKESNSTNVEEQSTFDNPVYAPPLVPKERDGSIIYPQSRTSNTTPDYINNTSQSPFIPYFNSSWDVYNPYYSAWNTNSYGFFGLGFQSVSFFRGNNFFGNPYNFYWSSNNSFQQESTIVVNAPRNKIRREVHLSKISNLSDNKPKKQDNTYLNNYNNNPSNYYTPSNPNGTIVVPRGNPKTGGSTGTTNGPRRKR